jgi:hypothetical protein
MKPCEPTKMTKEDLFLASRRSNNEYLGSVIPLFQTVSEPSFSETQKKMPVAVAQFPFVLPSCRKSLTFSGEGRTLFCDLLRANHFSS